MYRINMCSRMEKVTILAVILSFASSSVIIPEELPSLLSVAYSNIPPIKKGSDSRIGFGYAFGNHADFQVLLELGPQSNTNPIGQTFPSNTKRQVSDPYAGTRYNHNKDKVYSSDAGQYLSNWAQKMRKPTKQKPLDQIPNLEDSMVELVKNEKGEYEIHQPSANIPVNVLTELKRLYGEKKREAENLTKDDTRSVEEIKKITEDLSNVDLD